MKKIYQIRLNLKRKNKQKLNISVNFKMIQKYSAKFKMVHVSDSNRISRIHPSFHTLNQGSLFFQKLRHFSQKLRHF